MDKYFAKFLELLALGYQVQCSYMHCDVWSNHDRVSLMTLAEIRNDFSKGRLRIDPLSCEEAAKLWGAFPKSLLSFPIRRNPHAMSGVALKAYSLYLSDFADALDSESYQKICDEGMSLLEGVKAKEKIVFESGYYEEAN